MLLEELEKQLDPCPLCDHAVRVENIGWTYDGIYTHIQCPNCGLELHHTQEFEEVRPSDKHGYRETITFPINEDAVTRWNKRNNTKMECTLVAAESGDWEALYIDGKLAKENHSLRAFDVLEALADNMAMKLDCRYIADEIAENGMPEDLGDLT